MPSHPDRVRRNYEDEADIEAAEQLLAEPGENIRLEDLKKELGLAEADPEPGYGAGV